MSLSTSKLILNWMDDLYCQSLNSKWPVGATYCSYSLSIAMEGHLLEHSASGLPSFFFLFHLALCFVSFLQFFMYILVLLWYRLELVILLDVLCLFYLFIFLQYLLRNMSTFLICHILQHNLSDWTQQEQYELLLTCLFYPKAAARVPVSSVTTLYSSTLVVEADPWSSTVFIQ